MQIFHRQPVPVVFAICQGVQQLASRAINLLGIFDRLTVYRLPDGTAPDAVTLQVVTIWTGGQGEFEQVLRVLDQDGSLVGEARTAFALEGTSHRYYNINLIAIPVREGIYTLTVGRSEEELLRQDFTVEIAPFPGAAQ